MNIFICMEDNENPVLENIVKNVASEQDMKDAQRRARWDKVWFYGSKVPSLVFPLAFGVADG